jgi:diacylglycerol kinase (ATP)
MQASSTAFARSPAATPVAPQRRARVRTVRSLAPHVLLVANANASGIVRRPELVGGAAGLLRTAGAQVEARLTETPDELGSLLAATDRRVVLLGGDGSVHAAANVAAPTPELALMPAGGANNVARSLGVPSDLAAAARLAVEGFAGPLDLIAARTANGRYLGVEGVSIGFHAIARAGYRGGNSADTAAGLKTGLATLARFRPITVAIEARGTFRLLRVAQLFVVNTPLFGPGLHVAPDADPADGLLELVTLEADSRASLLALIPHLRRGTHLGRPGVRRVQADRLRIATGGNSPVIVDTTDVGSGTVELRVQPGSLAVVGAPR